MLYEIFQTEFYGFYKKSNMFNQGVTNSYSEFTESLIFRESLLKSVTGKCVFSLITGAQYFPESLTNKRIIRKTTITISTQISTKYILVLFILGYINIILTVPGFNFLQLNQSMRFQGLEIGRYNLLS